MHITSLIDKYLQDTRTRNDGKLTYVDNSFIYAYGPYMAMNSIYDKACIEISKNNPLMEFITIAAHGLRSIRIAQTREERKEIIKKITVLANSMDHISSIDVITRRDTLLKFNKDYIIPHNARVLAIMGSAENFIAASSPIVQYNARICKEGFPSNEKGLFNAETYTDTAISGELHKLLVENLFEILDRYTMLETLSDTITETSIGALVDKFMVCTDMCFSAKKYMLLSLFHYNGIDKIMVINYMNFMNGIASITENDKTPALESLIKEANTFNPKYSSIDEIGLIEEPEFIEDLLKNKRLKIAATDSDISKYDFTKIDNFVFSNLYMQFDQFANSFFTSTIKDSSILNVNDRGAERIYYEMNDNTIVCPFTDLRDYGIKLIVAYANNDEINIINNWDQIY